jgi:hypothetical protein
LWASAAKHMAKFDEGVVNAVDAEGYPLSVRQTSLPYDPNTGEMPVTLPDALGAVEGPASLLCHFHDENLWGLRAILLKGKLARREGKWIFVTTSFTPPSTWQMIKNVKKSARDYLAKRNLPWPVVNYAAIDQMWAEVKAARQKT